MAAGVTADGKEKQMADIEILQKQGVDPDKYVLFQPTAPERGFGTPGYFEDAVDAGFYGVDDREVIAFKKRSA